MAKNLPRRKRTQKKVAVQSDQSKLKSGVLWLCGYAWTVEIIHKKLYYQGRQVHGVTDGNAMKIEISTNDASDQVVRSTMVHELLHGIWATVTNGYPEEEESSAQCCEVGIFSALTDERNDWFWLQVRGRGL